MAMKAMKSATKTMATKAMKAIQWKEYYQKNKARIVTKRTEYYQKNKARIAAKQKEYNASPQGKAYRQWKKEDGAVYYQKNKARIAEYNAVYYQKNKARLAAMQAMKAKKVGRKSLTVLAGTNDVSPKRAKKQEYNAVYYQKKKARLAAMQKKYMREYRCTVLAQAVSPKRFREWKCHACLRLMEILEQDALYLTRRLWVAWKAFTFNRGESD